LHEIPRTIRFSKKDIANYSSFHKELAENVMLSNKEIAEKLARNNDWNTAKEIAGFRDVAEEFSKHQIEAADKIAETITSNTDRNIANRDYNTERNMANRDYNTDRVIGALDELKGVFDWKLSELIWIQEKQTSYLQNILKALETPRLTRANELREDGLKKYNNGWIEEAIEDFNQAKEINTTDFIVHQSLGNIYLFQMKDPERALKCYKDASKYSIEFPYYNSYALLHVGLSNYFLKNYVEAYAATKEAIEKTPNLIEAYYQNARYCSKLGKDDEAISNLRIAIETDREYLAKVLLEDDFEPMMGKIKDFFGDLLAETRLKAEKELDQANKLISEFGSIGDLDLPRKKLIEAEELKRKGSYIDYRDTIYKAYAAEKMAIDSLVQYLSNQKTEFNEDYKKVKSDLGKLSYSGSGYALIGAVVAYYFIATDGWRDSDFLSNISLDGNLGYVALLFPILYIISIAIYNINKMVINGKTNKVSTELKQNENLLLRVNTLKKNLKLDEIFSGYKNEEYNSFLIKKYG
jgi:tetratricopeptide (TPR) repeat protein